MIMARALTMPKLSDSMEDATIVRWLKSEGEQFRRGEPLAEIETDKATVVYEAESDGVIARFVVQEGGTARVGDEIAALDGGDSPRAMAPAATSGDSPQTMAPPDTSGDSPPNRARATPVARRRAVELGVSLHGLAGTGPGGRITATDVERAAGPAPAPAPAPVAAAGRGEVELVELTPTQATIASRMALSAATIPAFTVTVEIDASLLVALRTGTEELVDPVPSVNDFLVRAAALTLRAFPAFNGGFVDGRVERWSRVNVGIAVALEGALLVPVLRDADRKSLRELATESRALLERTRSRTLAPDDLADGTFTVSNLGPYGVHSFTAIVAPPQAAILALGGIGANGTLLATMSADHRVVYGADAAQFLDHLKRLLEHPLALLL